MFHDPGQGRAGQGRGGWVERKRRGSEKWYGTKDRSGANEDTWGCMERRNHFNGSSSRDLEREAFSIHAIKSIVLAFLLHPSNPSEAIKKTTTSQSCFPKNPPQKTGGWMGGKKAKTKYQMLNL